MLTFTLTFASGLDRLRFMEALNAAVDDLGTLAQLQHGVGSLSMETRAHATDEHQATLRRWAQTFAEQMERDGL